MSDQPFMPARRTVLTGAAALAAVGFVPDAARAAARPGFAAHLTVLGTTDLHGNVYNWDYFKNATYSDPKNNNQIGIAKAATLIKAIRAKRAGEPVITLDAGDTIQGTPLAYYYA